MTLGMSARDGLLACSAARKTRTVDARCQATSAAGDSTSYRLGARGDAVPAGGRHALAFKMRGEDGVGAYGGEASTSRATGTRP